MAAGSVLSGPPRSARAKALAQRGPESKEELFCLRATA